MIPLGFGLEGTSNIKPRLTHPVAGDRGLRVQFLGERLRVYSLVSVHWSLLFAWNVTSTQMRDHLQATDSGRDRIFPVVSNRHLLTIYTGAGFQDGFVAKTKNDIQTAVLDSWAAQLFINFTAFT